jgi:glycosyltransferase 2 family protein
VTRLRSTQQCQRALAELEFPVSGLRSATHQTSGRTIFVGEDASGELRISAWGRREAVVQFFARLWHSIAFRDPPRLLPPTRRGQVEYEASVERLAGERGVSVPLAVLAATAQGLALLVERVPVGRRLSELDPDELTDSVLEAIWTEVQTLHNAGIAHGKLDAHHLVIAANRPMIVGFEAASTDMSERQSARDIAQMLAATAAVVGPDRAVTAAARVLGPEDVAVSLAYVQPKALSGWTHDAFGGRSGLDQHLERLRASAEQALDAEPAAPHQLYRVHPRTLLMAIGAFVAVATLLSRIGNPTEFWNTIRGADWTFVVLAFGLGLLRDVVFGVTFLGNVPIRIPIWPSIELQVAMAFSNLAVPVAADSAIQIRFLQKNGLDIPSAIATGGVLSSLTEIAVQLGMFVLALRLTPDTLNFGHIDAAKLEAIIAGGILLIGVTAAVVFSAQRLRLLVVAPVQRALRTVWHAIKSPGRLALLIGGNVIAQLLSAVSLLACLHAYGTDVNFWSLVAISIGVGLIASVVPIPGGGTAVSAIGLAGMLTALGVPQPTSAAAVLTYQLVHSYLPAIPGWFATHDLIRKQLL